MRKQVFKRLWDHPHFYTHVQKCVDKGLYDNEILDNYSEDEFNQMQTWLDHKRDYNFTYAGLRQVIDKYLVQDRSTGEVFETPQFMYMMISATVFANYPNTSRMGYIKRYYDAISNFKINIPTPVMAGVRTLCVSMLVVCWLMLMILSIVFFLVIWVLVAMLHKGQGLVSTQVE